MHHNSLGQPWSPRVQAQWLHQTGTSSGRWKSQVEAGLMGIYYMGATLAFTALMTIVCWRCVGMHVSHQRLINANISDSAVTSKRLLCMSAAFICCQQQFLICSETAAIDRRRSIRIQVKVSKMHLRCWDTCACLCVSSECYSVCLAQWDAVTFEAGSSIWGGHPPSPARVWGCLECVGAAVGILKLLSVECRHIKAQPVSLWCIHAEKYRFLHNSKA